MKVLVTGFEPFGGETVNPSWLAVQKLPAEIVGAEVVKVQLPVVFGKAIEVLLCAVEKEAPDLVICVGQAGGRAEIGVERVAINLDDAAVPDNAGNQPLEEPVFVHGPNAYFARLPVKKIVQGLWERGIPAVVSNSAGTYVCNHVMYGLLHHIHVSHPEMMGGFVHVPYIPEQVVAKRGTPSMALPVIVEALRICIETALETNNSWVQS